MRRKANAIWKGNGPEGKGTLSTTSGVLDGTAYSAHARFKDEEGKSGTNPEELIAAAHAGCYAMALSYALTKEGFVADELDVKAVVHLDSVDGGFAITGIDLKLKGSVPEVSEEKFTELAEGAKENCPVSKALSAVPISLDITFG